MSDIKERIIQELDDRIDSLREHQERKIIVTGNQYDELNQALSKVIGAPLIGELEDLKLFVMGL